MKFYKPTQPDATTLGCLHFTTRSISCHLHQDTWSCPQMQRIPRNCGPALHLSPSLHSMLWALSARPFRFQKCQWCSGEGRNHEVEGKRSPAKGQSKCLISHWANHSLLAGWKELREAKDPYLPNIPVPNQNRIWQGRFYILNTSWWLSMSATHKLTEHGAPWILLQVATQLHKGTTKGSFSAQWCKKVVFQSPHNVPRDRSNRVCWILPRRMGILTMLLIPTKTNTNEQKMHNNLVVDCSNSKCRGSCTKTPLNTHPKSLLALAMHWSSSAPAACKAISQAWRIIGTSSRETSRFPGEK